MPIKIAELLENSGEPQWFDDLPDEELEKFGASFRKTITDSPVVLAATDPPVLVEGRQRLRMLAEKYHRTTLNDGEFVIADHIKTREAAEIASITRNVNRRQLPRKQLGAIYQRLMDARGLNQSEVARLMGVSQPAVSMAIAAANEAATVTEITGPHGENLTDAERAELKAHTGALVPQPREGVDGEGESDRQPEPEQQPAPAPPAPELYAPPRLTGMQRLAAEASNAWSAVRDLPDLAIVGETGAMPAWTIEITPGQDERVRLAAEALRDAAADMGVLADLLDRALAAAS